MVHSGLVANSVSVSQLKNIKMHMKSRYIYRKYTPGSYVITPQGAWFEIYKKIEISKIEII